MERTLAIVKPDAVKKGLVGEIIGRIEAEGFRIAAMKLVHPTKKQAEGFYEVHRGKHFFDELTDFMASGSCVLLVLEGEEAIDRWRRIIGTTNPEEADEGTIRKKFGQSIQNNAVHGSDSLKTAHFEISYFFSFTEIVA